MPKPLVIFFLFAAAYFLSYFYRAANAVIAGDLIAELRLTAAQLGLMTSLFFIGFGLTQLPLGSGLDRFGPRWITPSLMLFAALGSLVFASAQSFAALALGRTMIGIGMAGVLMGALKAFRYWFPPERYGTVSSLLMGIGALGALFAATPLAWLNAHLGWRAVFAGSAAAIALSALAIMLWGRNAPAGVSWRASGQEGTLGDIYRNIHFWRIAPLKFAMGGTLLAVQGLWGGPYLVDGLGFSQVAEDELLLAMGVGVALGYLSSGWLADRFGFARVIFSGGVIFCLSSGLFALERLPTLLPLALLYFTFGLTGAFSIALFASVRPYFPPALLGRATTAVNLFGSAGTALIQWGMGLIIGAFSLGVMDLPHEAYSLAFMFTTALNVLALLWYAPMLRASQPLAPAKRR